MYRAEIFLVANLSIIIVLLLYQPLSFRITFLGNTTLTIEYFPLKLILYNFQKRKNTKKKLIKQTKRLLFFLQPILKSVYFLLKRSNAKIYRFSLPTASTNEPHTFFISHEIANLLKSYIYSALYYLTNSMHKTKDSEKNEEITAFDLQVTTRLYNVALAFFALVFFSLKKKGRNKKFV